eukprot:CAMPEP_0182916104 /NCGR_PEP_ID=MMETSP0105_2-20130417/746_1 /TAXON_ID=81532 ORGANISM="Acanthoeca-like sp., Strain 10tr" /NCGR_SAMPLE_ID=MMETSP0105_2 /ASSEMBLY_ACC=CAM_ASM_000205 /LENGTH=412 /DNA_ID=CAMNT_0025053033 /DNA_START=120 /DNA_END=1358 /DNA_ORIENTATION=-
MSLAVLAVLASLVTGAKSVGTVAGNASCSQTYTGSTSGARHTVGHPAPEIWYLFTAPASGQYNFNTCGSAYDTWIHLYRRSGAARGAQVSSCDDCGPCGVRTVLSVRLSAGQYYLVVDGFSSRSGTYRVAISCPATQAPTEQPTRQPTEQPTRQPTERPTQPPTAVPTSGPTAVPTAPTAAPTTSPTITPTASPTPSQAPTAANAASSAAAALEVGGFPFWGILVAIIVIIALGIGAVVKARRSRRYKKSAIQRDIQGMANPRYDPQGPDTSNSSYGNHAKGAQDEYLDVSQDDDGPVEDKGEDAAYGTLVGPHAVNPNVVHAHGAVIYTNSDDLYDETNGVYEAPSRSVSVAGMHEPSEDLYAEPAKRPERQAIGGAPAGGSSMIDYETIVDAFERPRHSTQNDEDWDKDF